MLDWLPGIIVALVAAIPGCWGLIQQRHRTAAETGKASAETEGALVAAYKFLVGDLREQLNVAQQGLRIEREENRSLREVNAVLYEQNLHCGGLVTQLTARVALLEGHALYNTDNDVEEHE